MEVEQGELYRQDDSEYEAVTELLLSDGLKLIGEDITVTFLDWEDYDYDKQESLDERLNDYS